MVYVVMEPLLHLQLNVQAVDDWAVEAQRQWIHTFQNVQALNSHQWWMCSWPQLMPAGWHCGIPTTSVRTLLQPANGDHFPNLSYSSELGSRLTNSNRFPNSGIPNALMNVSVVLHVTGISLDEVGF